VADTREGAAAWGWAFALLEASAQAGLRVPLLFAGFEAPPELPAEVVQRAYSVASRVEVRGLSAIDAAHLCDELAPAVCSAPWWLAVGAPALVYCEPALRVLITHGQAPLRWPASLRGLRHEIGLLLNEPRPALARHLAHVFASSHSA
jgi:hypothetical protein